jgi:hypothetical protein
MRVSNVRRETRIRVRQQRPIRHKRLASDESTCVDLLLAPAEPELRAATRLVSRGGRSERECRLSSMPGRPIEELLPRAQAFADAQTREALRHLNLEANVAAQRPAIAPTASRPIKPSATQKAHNVTTPCTAFLFDVLDREPEISAPAFFLEFDRAIHRERNENRVKSWQPPESWVKDTGKRLWAELHRHRLTKKRAQTWFDRRRAEWRGRKEAATQMLP